MAVASVGSWGTAAHSTSASSFTFTTQTNALDVGKAGVLVVVTDNYDNSSGTTDFHLMITGGDGVWDKVSEYTNSAGSVANGVTTSIWLFNPTGAVPVGTVMTIHLDSAVVDKCCVGHVFSVGSNSSLMAMLDVPVKFNAVLSGNDFGAASFSGLPSQQYLFVRGMGKEANSDVGITPSSGHTAIGNVRSRNDAAAVLARGEFRIATATSSVSNPSLAVSGRAASLYAVFGEYVGRVGTANVSLGMSMTAQGTLGYLGEAEVSLGISAAGAGELGILGEAAVSLGIGSFGEGSIGVEGIGSVSIGISAEAIGFLGIQGQAAVSIGITAAAYGGSIEVFEFNAIGEWSDLAVTGLYNDLQVQGEWH